MPGRFVWASTAPRQMNRNLWLVSILQGLFLTNNVTFIATNGLVGLTLAPYGWLATLLVMGYVVGGALGIGPMAWTQKHLDRRISFMLGLAVALGSALFCVFAAYIQSVWLLCVGTVIAGLLLRERSVVPVCRRRAG